MKYEILTFCKSFGSRYKATILCRPAWWQFQRVTVLEVTGNANGWSDLDGKPVSWKLYFLLCERYDNVRIDTLRVIRNLFRRNSD